MSRYCEDDECGKKKSSATAKTALGLAIGGLGLAAVNGGLFNNGCGGGLLGNLFGGNNEYCQAKADNGARAVTELQMLNNWIMPLMARTSANECCCEIAPYKTELQMLDKYIFPMMNRTCQLEKEMAVNAAVDQKNQVINGLLFKMAENNTNAKFDLAQCQYDGKFALAQQSTDDKFLLSRTITDAEFALGRALTKAEISEATCNVVRGVPYISPCQMADPYQAGTNILLSRHVNGANTRSGCCGGQATFSNGGCWSGCDA